MINILYRSICAGLMIGIAGAIYLAVGPPLGAILFAIGLIIICNQNYILYTGRIGYIQHIKEVPGMGLFILGNALGTLAVAATQLLSPANLALAQTMMEAKLALPWWMVLIKAIGCGFLMYLAVNIYKTEDRYKYLGIITCIPAFILAGFEHSIADFFYFWCGSIYNWKSIIFLALVIVGNAIGANIHLVDKIKK